MKFAFVLISLMAAIAAAQAAPSQAVASLTLAQQASSGQSAPTVLALADAQQAAATEQRRALPIATETVTAPTEGPSSGTETTLVMVAAGVLALLAVSRRRRQ